MRILRVDLSKRSWRDQDLTGEAAILGGRGLCAAIVSREIPAGCDPLGYQNHLVIAGGALAGFNLSSAGRASFGAKSPLTGGIKEANAGGTAAEALAGLGLRGVVLEGLLPAGPMAVLVIDGDGCRFVDASPYCGLGNFALAGRLFADFGRDYSLITIGQAGERRSKAAALAVSDAEGRPSRMAARGGLGAVLGAKGLKAVMIARKTGQKPVPADREAFAEARKAYHQTVASSDRIQVLAKYGTASTMMVTNSIGALPTRNFSAGVFAGAENLSGERLYEVITARGGQGTPTHACMEGCVIRCSNCFAGPDGREVVAPIEYETLGMMGSNLGLDSLDDVAQLNFRCNDYGLDTIETGAALGVLAECGQVAFGDGAGFIALLEEVAADTKRGRLIADGAEAVGRAFGAKRVPVAKGQAVSAYDPRGVKGTGVTYATSPMGGDHTAGLTVFANVDHHATAGQAALSAQMQVGRAYYDALGLCTFLQSAIGGRPGLILDLLNKAYGLNLKDDYLSTLGRRVISTELAYNDRIGLSRPGLPDFFTQEKLGPDGLTFDVPQEEMERIIADFRTAEPLKLEGSK
ncbi:MAG TPA: aldehyde ferredoxin oxidoreductase C-terminal domain-containing protein [Bacillota bacterium]|jgi:aldehyde:ferredoxin oxidoreductase